MQKSVVWAGMLLGLGGWDGSGLAQIAPDVTLPTIVMSENGRDFTIEGGTRSGSNLFHSFSQFSVPTGGTAHFNNAIDVQNILSRVTGTSLSIIDGLLQANGSANVFLLNPNGLLFGANAHLNLGGSLIGTTASSLQFADGSTFEATPSTQPVFTVSAPIGLQMGPNPGNIRFQGTGYPLSESNFLGFAPTSPPGTIALEGKAGTTLAFIGRGIQFDDASLTLSNGNLELGSVAAEQRVTLLPHSQGWTVGYSPNPRLADITLRGRSLLNLGGFHTSQLHLVGQTVRMQGGAMILSQNFGSTAGQPLRVQADRLEITGIDPQTEHRSGISSETFGSGSGAPIWITGTQINVADGGAVLSKNASIATSGDIVIQATQWLHTNGVAPSNPLLTTNIGSMTFGSGKPGNVRITTPLLQVTNGSGIVSTTFRDGPAANLILSSDRVEVSGTSVFQSPSTISSTSLGAGNSGEVQLATHSLRITAGADLGTSSFNQGDAGNIWITARDSVQVSGQSAGGASSISSSLRPIGSPLYQQQLGLPNVPEGRAGSLTITTPELEVAQGGRIYAGNEGQGDAGTLTLQADRIRVFQQGTIEAKTLNGNGGNVKITAGQSLVLQNGSQISASAGELGNGGNIQIDAPVIVGIGDSDVIASAVQGRGGNIAITTQGIFGLTNRDRLTPDNDINASSDFGISGAVQITDFALNQNAALDDRPLTFVSPDQAIAGSCIARRNLDQGRFVITGNGGLPPSPIEPYSAIAYETQHDRPLTGSALTPTPPWQEATALVQTVDGRLLLVASPFQSSRSSICPP